MKKTKLVAILLLIVLTLTLSSCALGDWILGLGSIMKKITNAMDGISSFHMEGEMSFTVYAMGKTVEIDGVMEKIFIEEDDKFFAECLLFCPKRSALQAIFCFCLFFYNFAEYS